MDKEGKIKTMAVLLIFVILVVSVMMAENSYASHARCHDSIDNDNDTFIDYPADPGCWGYSDDHEFNF